MKAKVVFALVALVACSLAVGASDVGAKKKKKKKYPTTVTAEFVDNPVNDEIRGTATSPKPDCPIEQNVQVYQEAGETDVPISQPQAVQDDSSWNIFIEGGAAPGTQFYAVAPKASFGKTICKQGVSPVVTAP
jgi:hypothetical protein